MKLLQQRIQRWGQKRYRVKGDSHSSVCIPDGSTDALRVLRRADVIRADIQHISNELLAVREAQHILLVAVNEKEKTKLHQCLSGLRDRAKRAQLLLCSLDSLYEEEDIPDGIPVRISKSQQVTLGHKLLEVVHQLRECEDDLAATLKKRQCRSHCLGIAIDCVVLPLSILRLKSGPIQKRSSCPEIFKKVGEDVFPLIFQEKYEVVSGEKRLADLRQITSAVEELVSYQSDTFNNIEHYTRASLTTCQSCDSRTVCRKFLHSA